MRGVFTSGVLDNFMDRGIYFPYTIGVSAGACNGLSYMSHQRGRAKFSNIDLLEKYRYIGFKHLITKGNIMDFNLLFHTFPEKIIPYDYEKFAQSEAEYEMVTTNCITGEACYFNEKRDPKRIIDIVKASSSLPFLCPITRKWNSCSPASWATWVKRYIADVRATTRCYSTSNCSPVPNCARLPKRWKSSSRNSWHRATVTRMC